MRSAVPGWDVELSITCHIAGEKTVQLGMVEDLVQWLGEQLDVDKRDAEARRGTFPSPGVDDDGAVWLHVRPGGNAVIVRYRDPAAGYEDMAKLRNWADAEHGWTQERVLREIDAKRQIAEQHRPVGYGDVCLSYCHTRTPSQPQTWPCLTLRLLALPYADRPGYREEWRP